MRDLIELAEDLLDKADNFLIEDPTDEKALPLLRAAGETIQIAIRRAENELIRKSSEPNT